MLNTYRFLVFSDLHAHNYKRFATLTDEGMNSRLHVCINVLKYGRQLARETGIKNFLFPGDLFDAKNRVPVTVIRAVMREFVAWSQAGLKLWAIPGNHDFAVRSGELHGLEIFAHLEGFHIFTEPRLAQVHQTAEGQDFCLSVFPYRERWDTKWFAGEKERLGYMDEYERLGEIQGLGARIPNICLIHGTLESDRFTSDSGIIPDHEGLTNNDLIKEDWLWGYDLACIGHVHTPHRYNRNGKDTHLLVPGCPWQEEPGDWHQKRGIWEITWTDSGVPENLLMKCHEVPGIPKFVYVPYNRDGILSEAKEALDVEGNIMLLVPQEPDISEEVSLKMEGDLLHWGAAYVDRVAPDFHDHKTKEMLRVNVNEHQKPEDVVRAAVESSWVDLEGKEPELVIETAMSFINGTEDAEDSFS